jgi:hypothetical protein
VDHRLAPLFDWRSAICDSELTSTQRHVALTLSLHMNARGGSAMPAVQTLVRETGLSKRAVQYALKGLHDDGWLEKRPGLGMNGTNLYLAAIPAHVQLARPPSTDREREGLTPSGAPGGPPRAAPAPPAHGAEIAHAQAAHDRAQAGWRPWTAVYDALIDDLYAGAAHGQLTREEKRRLGIVARELHEAGATADDVHARVAAYRIHPTYRDVALTAMSLRAHWSELAPKAPPAPPCPECGIGGGHHAEGCSRAGR